MSLCRNIALLFLLNASFAAASPETASTASSTSSGAALSKADGYRGIWYMNQPQDDEYRFKYSGGFATYPQQHIPIAVYSSAAHKTFFCYGGTTGDKKPQLLHMVSYYDHATGRVPRPTVLLNKRTDDAHDNPILQIDEKGHLWVFSPSHGTGRPTYLHRSRNPYDIDSFEEIPFRNFSYPQAWHFPGRGVLLLHTRYEGGRSLFWMTSADGRSWSPGELLSRFGEGHYQISWKHQDRVATAFNYHPKPGGLNARTNLYYLETPDMGQSWRTADGTRLAPPLQTTATAALVRDYQAEGLLVYLKDLNFDAAGHPVILYLTSRGYASGPKNDPRTWHTARWTGRDWIIRPVTTSDSNYDFGSLYVEEDGTWRIFAPTVAGPQPYNPGGEVVMWTSRDEGASWKAEKQLTRNSSRNHTYIRRPLNAHPDFYALWADGDARRPSESALYYTNRTGDAVWRLPVMMTEDTTAPEVVNAE